MLFEVFERELENGDRLIVEALDRLYARHIESLGDRTSKR